jgi:cobalamin synthase
MHVAIMTCAIMQPMRAAFALFTALPLDADGEQPGVGWVATSLVGLTLGLAWLVFHQLFVRLGGPFVAAGGVLLLHAAVTGARPLRGMAAVAGSLAERDWPYADVQRWADDGPDGDAEADADTHAGPARPLALPAVDGAGTAAVTLLLLAAAALLVRLAELPALLVVVPVAAKSAQALLLRAEDDQVGVDAPTAGQKLALLGLACAATLVAPLTVEAIRPERLDATLMGLQYVAVGIAAIVVALLVGMLVRAWLRARFGVLDADRWHAIGAATELAALATVVSRI